VTDLGTGQRRDADDGGAPPAALERQRTFRVWPPEISWDARPLEARVRAAASGLTPAALWRNHRLFTVAVGLSLIPRIVAALGFKPALFIQDSFSYMKQSVQLLPLSELRPAGYPLVLHLLQPFHSLLLVTTLQHLMGIALAVIIYAVLRTRGLPGWGATLAAVPTLFDSRQIWLESSILPDTLFTLVLVIAVAILVVRPRPAIWQAALVGLLVSWASVIRGNGAPVIVIILAFLLIMRAGWKAFTACLAAFAIPLAAYALIFFSEHGQLNITNSTGLFLWSRTMSFANCSVIKPPADLVPLCPENQPDHLAGPAPAWSVTALLYPRPPANYLWAAGVWYQYDAHPGINAYNNQLAMQFAERAIAAQPLDYITTVGKEVLQTFFATDRPQDYLAMHFTVAPHVNQLAPYMRYWENRYAYAHSNTHVVQPWAYFMFLYQAPVWFPGWVFFLVMAGGLVLVIRRWRGWGRYALLPWGVAVVNLVLPIAAHEMDYRYAISAVPFACLALGLTLIRRPVPGLTPAAAAAPAAPAASAVRDGSEAPAARDGSAAPAARDGSAAPAPDGAEAD
jgi:hypothetical protein